MIQTISTRMFCTNKHFQTILPTFSFPFLLPAVPISHDIAIFQRHSIVTADGAMILVDSHIQKDTAQSKNDVLFVHGLEGSSESSYMIRFAKYAFEQGFNVHRMNLRGCGASFPFNPIPYHAGLWQDVRDVCQKVKIGKELFLVGFSLGGNVVLKMAGELKEAIHHYARGVVSISGAIDLAEAAIWLDQNRLYQKYLLWYLVQNYKKRCRHFPKIFNGLMPRKPRTLFEFDNQVTARVHGFQDANDYFARSSSCSVLHQIQIPTLLLYAQDDPVVPIAPYHRYKELLREHSCLYFMETEHGGHVGFMGPTFGKFHTHTIVNHFFQTILSS